MNLVVTGSAASAGADPWHLLHDVQYVLGLRRIGHEVLYVDDCVSTAKADGEGSDACAEALDAACGLFHSALRKRWHFHDARHRSYGRRRERVVEYTRSAEFVVDLSRGSCRLSKQFPPESERRTLRSSADRDSLEPDDFHEVLPTHAQTDDRWSRHAICAPICIDFVRDHAEAVYERPRCVFTSSAVDPELISAARAHEFEVVSAGGKALDPRQSAAQALGLLANSHLAILSDENDTFVHAQAGFALALGVPTVVLEQGSPATSEDFHRLGFAMLSSADTLPSIFEAVDSSPQSLSEAALRTAERSIAARSVLPSLIAPRPEHP